MNGTEASRISGGNSAYGRAKGDLYPTPPEVTYALLDFLRLPGNTRIWEPACGNGDMVHEMEVWGYQVTGTDISMGQDFLTVSPVSCDWIITNPPFSLSEVFIRRCQYIEAVRPAAEKPVLARKKAAGIVSGRSAGVGASPDMAAGLSIQNQRQRHTADGRTVVCLGSTRAATVRDTLPAAAAAGYGRHHINGTSPFLRFPQHCLRLCR